MMILILLCDRSESEDFILLFQGGSVPSHVVGNVDLILILPCFYRSVFKLWARPSAGKPQLLHSLNLGAYAESALRLPNHIACPLFIHCAC